MSGDLIFSNARAKSLENTLLTSEKVTRMLFAENLEEGVKILFEANYGGGVQVESFEDFESLLSAEDKRVTTFLREALPEKSGLEAFLLEHDYHNAKSSMKAKHSKTETKEMFAEGGLFSADAVKEAVFSENYTGLPDEMQKALKSIENAFQAGAGSPRFIDVTLDKALYVHKKEVVAACRQKAVKEYFSAEADFKNIGAFFRCRLRNLSEKFFSEGFLAGGGIEQADFVAAFALPAEQAADAFKYKDGGAIVQVAAEDIKANLPLVGFEAAADNYLLDIFKKDRGDIFTIAPVAGFYAAKKTEIKVVRLILTCLKARADKEIIKKRLRDLYV